MTVYTAPQTLPDTVMNGLFVAGGISNCPDWQAEVVDGLVDLDVTLFNPRRSDYPDTVEGAKAQITWEFNAFELLTPKDAVLFWFPKETLCPITLFELGRFSHQKDTTLFVGVHPDYQRRLDVETQLELARPEIEIVYSVPELIQKVRTSFPKA